MANAYTDQTSIQCYVYPNALNQFLADNADGSAVAGLLATIIGEVSSHIDGLLANIYQTPFPAWPGCPSLVHAAATMFACEAIYDRRLPPEVENPYRKRADYYRKRLAAVGTGEEHLDLKFPRAFYQGNAELEPVLINRNSLGI